MRFADGESVTDALPDLSEFSLIFTPFSHGNSNDSDVSHNFVPLPAPKACHPGEGSVAPIIHALNVLCSLFKEGCLNTQMQPNASAAYRIVLQSYQSPNWAVRNAATRLFASVTERCVGRALNQEWSTRIPFGVFFQR